MDALKKWHYTKPPPYQNGRFPQNFCSKHAKWFVQHSSTSPYNSDDLCLLFCLYPSSMDGVLYSRYSTVQLRMLHDIMMDYLVESGFEN